MRYLGTLYGIFLLGCGLLGCSQPNAADSNDKLEASKPKADAVEAILPQVPRDSMIRDEERDWIAKIVARLEDDDPKLAYADWLERRNDDRANFLQKYVLAIRSMNPAEFPPDAGLPEEWLELIGYRLMARAANKGFPELKSPILRLARPALRMKKEPTDDQQIKIGASKVGGLPDLPPGFVWPPGGECRAIYNDDTGGTERLAGFLAQINLAEIANTQAAHGLPKSGLLSFFCFQDMENDHPDAIGVKAILIPGTPTLTRMEPPKRLTKGNEVFPVNRLILEETLDLPESFDGPWSDEMQPAGHPDYSSVLDHFRSLNFDNILGYGRATSGADPTPDRQSRHLIVLSNAAGCRLHIQISQNDLNACNFDAIRLKWVDFD